MVQVLRSQRPRVGMAGRRKRQSRPNNDESYIYYTATNGQTIFENDHNIIADPLHDASEPRSLSLSSTVPTVVSTSTVTPLITKPFTRNVRPKNALSVVKRHNYMDTAPPHQITAKTDTSVQVSVDDDDNRSTLINDNTSTESSLHANGNDNNNTFALQEEHIAFLTKQLQEKEKQITQFQQSQKPPSSHDATMLSPATIARSNNIKSKTVQSLLLQLDEMKQKHSQEVTQLKLDVTMWKEKASSLALEVERVTKYSRSRNVYNGRFLLEESITTESTNTAHDQNEPPKARLRTNNDTTRSSNSLISQEANDKPRFANNMLSPPRDKKHTIRFDRQAEMAVTNKPVVSPRTLQNVTYLGKPLSFQYNLDENARFQLMVLSPVIDDDDNEQD